MYIVIELQVAANGSVANIVTAHATVNEAYSKYHTILSAAAISQVPIHSATILNQCGILIANEFFDHRTPEQEGE